MNKIIEVLEFPLKTYDPFWSLFKIDAFIYNYDQPVSGKTFNWYRALSKNECKFAVCVEKTYDVFHFNDCYVAKIANLGFEPLLNCFAVVIINDKIYDLRNKVILQSSSNKK